MSLRQFVWWESPGVRCRGFFVCGYGRGVLLLGLFPPRNRTEEQGNACAHHISRRAQAYAGPARELDWQRCVGLFLEGFSLLCELHGAQVSEGRVEPLVVVPPYVPVGVRAQLLHARVRVGVYELLLMRRLVDSTTALS